MAMSINGVKFFTFISICFWVQIFHGQLIADFKSISGNISFDSQSDGETDFIVDQIGLGIGIKSPSSKLHVVGNTVIENGNLSLGTTTGKSTLEIRGSMGFGIQMVSSNTTLESNTMIFADTSSSNIILTLPMAENVSGRIYKFKKITNSNTVTVKAPGLIDNADSFILSSSSMGFPFLSLIAQNNTWYIQSHSENVLSSLTASENLLGWWLLNESSGNIASEVISSNDSELINMTDADWVSGKIGAALDFDGDNDYTTSNAIMTAHGPLSVSAWIFSADFSKGPNRGTGIVRAFQSGDATYAFRFTMSNESDRELAFSWKTDSSQIFMRTGTIAGFTDSSWHHVVATYDGSSSHTGVTIYLNGSAVPSGFAVSSGTPEDPDGSWQFGLSALQDLYFTGKMDDVRIYNKQLSASEVQDIYRIGN